MGETRPVFAGLSHGEVIAWYGLIVASTAVFVWGVAMLVSKYRAGRRQPISHLVRRAEQMLAVVLSHRFIRRRDHLAGAGHLLVFYGFVALFAGTIILGLQVDVTKPIFGWRFWEGGFYEGYKLALDVAGLLLLGGLALLAANRWLRRPRRLDYARPDRPSGESERALYRAGDAVFVSTLAALALTGFVLEGFYLAEAAPRVAAWSPVGWVLMEWFRWMGLVGRSAGLAHHVLWWFHGVAALMFVSSIPFTKAMHMIVAPANLALRDPTAGKILQPLAAEAASEEVGYAELTDLSWAHLLSLDACTKCGKCTDACPAAAAGYPLSPRDLVLDLREVSEAAFGAHRALGVGPGAAGVNGEPAGRAPSWRVLGDLVRPESIWSCTQCMACVEICPVGIEHVPIINQFRRRLVEEGEMDPLLQSTLETIYESGNSFGEPRRRRPRWSESLDFRLKDARKEAVELLWFVGDYASFDPRSQRVSRAIAQILDRSGVDFGILYEGERTAGCDVRRAGEEGLFASLAEENVKAISSCR
ncbi:MAG: (Fe-S)-binding protein, partial [Acidimicrobiales bacterium]